MSFEILIKMKSPLAFHYFDTAYQGFDQEASLRNFMSKLLQIDEKKTVHYLLRNHMTEIEQKNIIQRCVLSINSERQAKQDKIRAQKRSEGVKLIEDIQETYDQLLNKFLDQIFEVNKDLIDDEHFSKQFNLYLKYNKDKLMNFM